MNCPPDENLERDCDSRSTVSSQLSDYSALGERERERHGSHNDNCNEVKEAKMSVRSRTRTFMLWLLSEIMNADSGRSCKSKQSPVRCRFLENLFPFSSNRRKNLKYRSLENNCHLVHFQDQSHPQETFNEHLKAQVWKLRDGSFEERESPLLSPVSNSFTLQETLFIEQLTAIDERVRFQVRKGCEVM